jgi:hypothetical protein
MGLLVHTYFVGAKWEINECNACKGLDKLPNTQQMPNGSPYYYDDCKNVTTFHKHLIFYSSFLFQEGAGDGERENVQMLWLGRGLML